MRIATIITAFVFAAAVGFATLGPANAYNPCNPQIQKC